MMKFSNKLINTRNTNKKWAFGLFPSTFAILFITLFLLIINISYAEKPSKRDLWDNNTYNENSTSTAKFIHADRPSKREMFNSSVKESDTTEPLTDADTVASDQPESPTQPPADSVASDQPEPQTQPPADSVASDQPEPQTQPPADSVASTQPEPQTQPPADSVASTQPEPQTQPPADSVASTQPEPQTEQPAPAESEYISSSQPEPAVTQLVSSLTQFGITWTFDHNYQVGTFANGDYWVVGPVRITKITPQSKSGSRIMNGSVLNPFGTKQGYDSGLYHGFSNDFSEAKNAALNVSASNPLVVQPGNSLVSTISLKTITQFSALDTAAILTVLSSAPAAGSFRPPYTGTDKTTYHNLSDIDYTKLGTLPLVGSTPNLNTLADEFEKPWIDHISWWVNRYLHPVQNMPDYGRELAYLIGNAGLSLMLNYSKQEKEKLLIRFVQFGIDTYGLAKNGQIWVDSGGHMHGRKLPMLLAGVVLNDQSMINMANGKVNHIFQEDRQTWYVEQSDVGRTLYTADGRPRERYIQSDVGIAEWGETHTSNKQRDGRNWNAYYRTIVGSSIIGHILTARLLGAESLWNWPALFSYGDRYWTIEKSNMGRGTNTINSFTGNMWMEYSSCAKYQCK